MSALAPLATPRPLLDYRIDVLVFLEEIRDV
jgi:hypothetical protein